jgi:glycerol-1-phosphate dehydrogenase [NAD(P)+]
MKHIWPIPKINLMPFTEISEPRDVMLIYSHAAYEAVKDRLNLKIVSQAEPVEATLKHWDALGEALDGEVIYAVGGGLAVDAAKYLAANHGLPLVCLPTALTVDAFLTWASGFRKDGCVYYTETKIPDLLIIDFGVLAAAPESIRAAGISDVLSIATGSWDWKFAEEQGQNPPEMTFIPYVYDTAQAILQGVIDCAEAAGRGDPDGLKQLLDCLALQAQLCNHIGHARPEEGSEHYFAYSVENFTGKGLPHGDLVGPGIVLMAGLQKQDFRPLKKALKACNVPLTNISDDVIRKTILDLPDYSRQHNLPFGIAHTLTESHLAQLPSLD